MEKQVSLASVVDLLVYCVSCVKEETLIILAEMDDLLKHSLLMDQDSPLILVYMV